MVRDHVVRWKELVKSGDDKALQDILADDVVFYSPVVFAPQNGKMITYMYLAAASKVLANEHFEYVGEYYSDNGVVLEFKTEVDGITIEGIDRIIFGADGRITEFKVMVRPKQAMEKLHAFMQEMLAKMQ